MIVLLGHRWDDTTKTDIYVTELPKDFESISDNIPGFPSPILVAIAIISVLALVKISQKRIKPR